MILHTIKNSFKLIIREKSMLFWAMIFPLVLAGLFKLAFDNLYEANQFEAIPIAVKENLYDDPSLEVFLDTMEDEKYFIISKAKDKKALNEEEIIAYVASPEKIITKKSGINETIVESIFNTYLRKKEIITRVLKKDPQANIGNIIEANNFVADKSKKNMNFVNVFFYTILGFQLIYGYSWGIEIVERYQANLSTIGKRNSIAPLNKKAQLFISLLVGWAFNFLASLFTIFVLKNFLDIDFGDRMGPLISLMALGALTGVTLGALIESVSRARKQTNEALGLGLTMVCSFLAGMMVPEVKVLLEEYAPLVNRINPVALITDGIYSLYYYDSLARFYTNIKYLALITGILILLTYIFTRGKQYASL